MTSSTTVQSYDALCDLNAVKYFLRRPLCDHVISQLALRNSD